MMPLPASRRPATALPASTAQGSLGLIIPPWLPGGVGEGDSIIDPGGVTTGLANLLATDWKTVAVRLGAGIFGVALLIAGGFLIVKEQQAGLVGTVVKQVGGIARG